MVEFISYKEGLTRTYIMFAIIVNTILTTFAMTTVVSVIHYVMLRAYEPVAKALAMRNIRKLNEEKNN